ncbi:MAG TPA: sodium:solute symporter family protein [Candidatus Cybelea sp.]|nr:sodium:solute symporter family protein [Candidatus Cybelea sp.]
MNGGASVALPIVGMVVFGTIAFALNSVRRIKMDPAQYIVAGRSFGTLFLWVLLAGEIYTTFTFLGVSGLAYAAGAPAFYAIAYGTCAYCIGYFLTPAVWRIAKDNDLLTGPDFFEHRYNSRALGVGVAVLQFVMIVPYVALQLSGLQILLRIAGYGSYNATASVCIGFIVLALFVFSAGLRGTAWASVVKDIFVLGAVLFAGIGITQRFFGSPSALFTQLAQKNAHMLTIPWGSAPHGLSWFISTIALSALGFYMGPQSWNAVYSARSGDTLRRNAVLLPIYQALLGLMLMAGFCAILIVPGLKGTDVDQSFLLVVQRYYPPWILGLVAAAGALAALVPASALLLAAASVAMKNIAGDVFNLGRTPASQTRITRILVLVVAVLALAVWLLAQRTVVELLLLYYNGVTQCAPGVFATFLWRRSTALGVGAGIVTGLLVAIPLAAMSINPWGINAGLIGLGANVIVLVLVSWLRGENPVSAHLVE